MGRWIGLDYGLRRIGVAIADFRGVLLAFPATTLHATGRPESDAAAVLKWAATQEPGGFVVGLPLNMDGTDSRQTTLTRAFAAELARQGGELVRQADQAAARPGGELVRQADQAAAREEGELVRQADQAAARQEGDLVRQADHATARQGGDLVRQADQATARQGGESTCPASKPPRRQTLPVELWDERLSSFQADEYLEAAGIRPSPRERPAQRRRRKERRDALAAQVILQSFLDARRPPSSPDQH